MTVPSYPINPGNLLDGAMPLDAQRFILSTRPPSVAQKRLALAAVLTLLIALALVAGPLSFFQPGENNAFVPAYAMAVFVIDLVTAVVLFAQFSILRSFALLAIASGYFYMALIVLPWMLTFPGIFAPGGLLGAGLQTTNWLYILWHVGFPLFVLAYAVLKEAPPAVGFWRGSARSAITLSVVATTAIVCAATIFVTAGNALLPRTVLDPLHFSSLRVYIAAFQILLSVAVFIALWVRQRSVLDLCLSVAMCAFAVEVFLIAFPVAARFTMGWYAGRTLGLISSSLVLFALLFEIATLYAQLLRAILAERRERDARLMTGDAVAATIAHEVNQPLAAMVMRCETGFRWLDRPAPDLDQAKAAFRHIETDGRRASAVIDSIRANFRNDGRTRLSLDVNDLIRESVALARDAVQNHRILVKADSNSEKPRIVGDQIQLQQVLFNLIINAIDSMAAKAGPRVLCVKSEVRHDGHVEVSVEDSGTGVSPQHMDRIFNPLFTTKAGGMGMGLSICRSIVEAHEGQLWVAPNTPEGTVFRFALRADTGAF